MVDGCDKKADNPASIPTAAQSSNAPTPEPEPEPEPEPDRGPPPPPPQPDLATLRSALVVEGGTHEAAPNLKVPEDWVTCRTGDDCVALEGGCCDHCNGGMITAVHKDYADKVRPYLENFGCEDSEGCTEIACDPPAEHEIACMTRACILVDVEPQTRQTMWGEPAGVPAGVPGGVVGGALGGRIATSEVGTSTPVDKPIADVKAQAIYSPDCDRRKLLGTKTATGDKRPGKTTVHFCVSEAGKTVDVETTTKFEGDPEVDVICRASVSKWRFRPFLSGGKPIKVCTDITFDIRFD